MSRTKTESVVDLAAITGFGYQQVAAQGLRAQFRGYQDITYPSQTPFPILPYVMKDRIDFLQKLQKSEKSVPYC